MCLMGVEYLVHTLGLLGLLWVIWFSLVYSSLFHFSPVQPGNPWGVSVLLSPGLDEGSPTGCLWWSPTGGEVIHMHHTLRNGLSH